MVGKVVTFMEAIQTCLRKYVTFSGRASRPEFWWFVLACFLVSAAITVTHGAIFGPSIEVVHSITINSDGTRETGQALRQSYNGGIIGSLISLAMLCPLLASGWRRLHDTGRAGWFLLIPLPIAVAGIGLSLITNSVFFGFLTVLATLVSLAFLIVMLSQKSQPGSNVFGHPQERATL